MRKCHFYQRMIQYLGHVISKEGIAMDLKNIEAIMDWLTSKNVTNMRSFMCLPVY